VNAPPVLSHDVRIQIEITHQLRIAVADSTGCREVANVSRTPGIIGVANGVNSVAIGAHCGPGISRGDTLTVLRGRIQRKLVDRKVVGSHPFKIRMTLGTCRRHLSPVGERIERSAMCAVRIAAAAVSTVAIDTANPLGRVDPSLMLHSLLGVAKSTRVVLGTGVQSGRAKDH
jgi:hypothetical protein